MLRKFVPLGPVLGAFSERVTRVSVALAMSRVLVTFVGAPALIHAFMVLKASLISFPMVP